MTTKNLPNSNEAGEDAEELSKLKSDPRYSKFRKLMRSELDEFVAEKRAAHKTSKEQAKPDSDKSFFDELFGGGD